MLSNEKMADAFYNYILWKPKILSEMASNWNEEFAKQMIHNLIAGGYLLYSKKLDEIVKKPGIVELFKGIWKKCLREWGIENNEVSMDEFREMVESEGVLDELVEGVTKRLVKYADMADLKELLGVIPRAKKFLNNEKLDRGIKEGLGDLLERDSLEYIECFLEIVPRMKELLNNGELDMAIKEGLKYHLSGDHIYDLQEFIEMIPRARELLDTEELKER